MPRALLSIVLLGGCSLLTTQRPSPGRDCNTSYTVPKADAIVGALLIAPFLIVGAIFLIDIAEDNDANGDEVPAVLPTGIAAGVGIPFLASAVIGSSRVDGCRESKGLPTAAELEAREEQARRDRMAEIARRVEACEQAGPAGKVELVTTVAEVQTCDRNDKPVARDQPIANGRVVIIGAGTRPNRALTPHQLGVEIEQPLRTGDLAGHTISRRQAQLWVATAARSRGPDRRPRLDACRRGRTREC